MPVVTTLATEEPEIMPVMPGRHHGGLGRPAAELAEQREGDLDEVVAGAGLLEQRAEQHEQEDEVGRDAERDAEHAFRGEPEMRGRARPSEEPLCAIRPGR